MEFVGISLSGHVAVQGQCRRIDDIFPADHHVIGLRRVDLELDIQFIPEILVKGFVSAGIAPGLEEGGEQSDVSENFREIGRQKGALLASDGEPCQGPAAFICLGQEQAVDEVDDIFRKGGLHGTVDLQDGFDRVLHPGLIEIPLIAVFIHVGHYDDGRYGETVRKQAVGNPQDFSFLDPGCLIAAGAVQEIKHRIPPFLPAVSFGQIDDHPALGRAFDGTLVWDTDNGPSRNILFLDRNPCMILGGMPLPDDTAGDECHHEQGEEKESLPDFPYHAGGHNRKNNALQAPQGHRPFLPSGGNYDISVKFRYFADTNAENYNLRPMQRKANRRDRKDGWYLSGLDSMHVMMPYMFGNRTDNEAVMGETVDLTAVDKYLAEKNAGNPEFKYTWFHVITAVIAKAILLRPKMNWFIAGGRFYERKKIEVAFNVKRKFADEAEEAMAKFVLDPEGGSPLEQVHDYVHHFVHKVRVEDKTEGITNVLEVVKKLPRPVFRFVAWTLKRLEYYGHYPQGLAKDDPCYSSAYITNLGSIKLNADYHHLFNWGTISFFVVISEKKLRPYWHEDGSYDLRNTIKLGLTVDERIADGYYFSKTLRLVRHLFAHPELLDLDAAAPVEFE